MDSQQRRRLVGTVLCVRSPLLYHTLRVFTLAFFLLQAMQANCLLGLRGRLAEPLASVELCATKLPLRPLAGDSGGIDRDIGGGHHHESHFSKYGLQTPATLDREQSPKRQLNKTSITIPA